MVIFISHEHTDDSFVNKLRTELHLRAFTTWVDHFDMPAGALWAQVIGQALTQSDVMLLVLSDPAIKSQHVSLEWSAFLDANKLIIPIRRRQCIMPMLLRGLHHLDFTNDDGFADTLELLLRVLPPPSDSDRPIQLNIPVSDIPSTVVGLRADGHTGELRRKAEGLTTDKLFSGQANVILPEQGEVIPFKLDKPIVVGRADSALGMPDIDLAPYGAIGRGVSRRHLLIANTTEGMTVTDLNSRIGTIIARRKLEPNRPVVIHSKTMIYLGNFPIQIEFRLPDENDTRSDVT